MQRLKKATGLLLILTLLLCIGGVAQAASGDYTTSPKENSTTEWYVDFHNSIPSLEAKNNIGATDSTGTTTRRSAFQLLLNYMAGEVKNEQVLWTQVATGTKAFAYSTAENGTFSVPNENITLKQGKTYYFKEVKVKETKKTLWGQSYIDYSWEIPENATLYSFTVRVYDLLTVQEKTGNADAVTVSGYPVKVYRGESASYTYQDKTNYTVKADVNNKEVTPTNNTVTVNNLTGDATILIKYIEDNATTVKRGEVSEASVKIGSVDLSTTGDTIAAGEQMRLTITPADNTYITGVSITNTATNAVINLTTSYTDGVATVTINAASTKTEYVLNVTAASPVISVQNDCTLPYEDGMIAQIREELIKFIATRQPANEAITDSNLTITYDASLSGGNNANWQALTYSPSGNFGDTTHAFGQSSLKTSEKVRFVYNPSDNQYPTVTLEFDVSLVKKSVVKLASDSSGDATVLVTSGIIPTTLTAQNSSTKVAQNSDHTITVSTLAGNKYISAFSIIDSNNNTIASESSVTPSSGAYSYTLSNPTADEYTISATTADIFAFAEAIEYNSFLTTDEILVNVKAALNNTSPKNSITSVTLTPSADGATATVVINFSDNTGKYPTLSGYGSATLTANLKDSRPETVIEVISGDALTTLQAKYTNTMTDAELTEELFVVLKTSGSNSTVLTDSYANNSYTITSNPAPSASSADSQSVTFTFAGDKNNKGSSATVTFQLTENPENATIFVSSNEGNATVQAVYTEADDTTKTVTLSNSEDAATLLPKGKNVTLIVTPADGMYVSDVNVWKYVETQSGDSSDVNAGGNTSIASEWQKMLLQDGFYDATSRAYKLSIGETEANGQYKVEVTSNKAALKLINNDSDTQYIDYNSQQAASVAENAILALIDSSNSDPVPSSSAGTITIEYLAGTVLNNEKWESLNYSPGGLDALAYHKFGTKSEEQVRITFDATDNRYPTTSRTFTVVLNDARKDTSIVVKNPQDAITYAVSPSMDAIIASISDGVIETDTQTPISGATVKMTAYNSIPMDESAILKLMNAGEHTVTLSYEGTANEYKACTANVTFTIDRALASIAVDSVVQEYNGKQISNPITVSAAAPNQSDTVEYITIVSGIDVNGEAFINVDMPDALGLGSLIGNGMTISLKQVSSTLNSLLRSTDVDSATIDAIKEVIDSIANMEMLEDATVTITMGKNIMPKDSGVYLIAGVISDTNYTTSAALNYAIIKPQAVEGKLSFNFEDDNFVVLLSNLSNYDFGAHIEEDGLTENQISWANSHIGHVFIGATMEGTPVISDTAPTEAGAYTQISFINAVANTDMVYAAPIVRPFVVVTEPVNVKFTTEERTFTYDRKQHGLDAAAYSISNGADITSQGKLTVYYSGVETDGDICWPTTTRPTECGTYNVTAIYVSNDKTKAGIATTTMLITLSSEATISVTDKVHTYDGTGVSVNDMVSSSPSDAARTIITGSIAVDGDFSKDGLSALTGTINVDLPPRADVLLDRVLGDRTVTASEVLSAIDSVLKTINDQLDSELLKQVRNVVSQLPTNASLTFNDNPSYSSIGAYLVVGVITDPNYVPVMDAGVLVIAPNVTEAELRWNYNDLNGVITRPVLDIVDLNASAYPKASTVKDEALTARVEYIIVGTDDEGNLIVTDNAANLPNGIYTQVAFIREEIGANMTLVKPIVRTFALVPQNVTVTIEDKTVQYNGKQHGCSVSVKKADGSGYNSDNLKVTYIGLDASTGWYNSQTAPTNVGAYLVVAEYEEYDSNNVLKYIGGDIGYLTITPYGTFDIADETTHQYDGTPKFVDVVSNPDNLPYISVIRDANNHVNIVFPSNWNVPQMSSDTVQSDLAALRAWLQANVPQEVQSTEAFTELIRILQGINVQSVSVNGAYPVEIGDYNVTCIAYGSNQGVMVDKGILHIVEVLPEPTPDAPTPTPNPTATPEPIVLPQTGDDSNPTLWTAMMLLSAAGLIALLLGRRKTYSN